MYIVSILSITVITSLYFITQITGPFALSEPKLLQQQQQQQQDQSFIAKLTRDNTIPPNSGTNATGIVKFITNAQYYGNNELYYEINLTNIHNDVARVDVHIGQKNENGPALATLYKRTTSLSLEICCQSADSEYVRTNFFFNGTISTQNFEFGPFANSKNITDLVKLFNNGSAYAEVYTYQPNSLSLLGIDSEISGQIIK